MAKKKNNTTTIVTEANLLDADKTVVLSNNQTEPPTTIINTEGVEVKKEKTLKDLDINELISFEKACALLCKRFETAAQLDFNHHFLFKEYQQYYEMIFNEIKERVATCCSKMI